MFKVLRNGLLRYILGRICLRRTVSDSISGAENCTVTRRSPAHWPVMSEGSRHVFNHLLYQILAWNFSSNVIRWHGFIFGLVCQGFEVLGRLDAAIFRLCREFLICSWRQNNPAISELLFLICSWGHSLAAGFEFLRIGHSDQIVE